MADRGEVDRVLAADPEKLEQLGDWELAAQARKEGHRLDPEAHVKRRRKAEADRHTTLRPAPDTMTWFGALLSVADGVATHAALLAAAETARAAGDERTKGQVMADTLVARVTGKPEAHDDTDSDEPDQPAAEQSGVDVTVNLTMSDQALFGTSDSPAHVDGYGPIPAELAREIITGACSREDQVHIRRLYTHPETGELVAMEARTRLFRGNLARFIKLRDRTCRTPWCDAPIRHTDHPEDWAADGPTTAVNGQGLCQACNHAKQGPGWRARPTPDPNGGHAVETITPTGHRYRTRPPLVATIHDLTDRFEFRLAG